MSLLKRWFNVERIGDLTIRQVKVLAYLGTTKAGGREPSAEKLADNLDIGSENTVKDALKALKRRGYVVLVSENLPERDSNSYDLTAKGRRALRYFLDVFGFAEFGLAVAISLFVGALIRE